MPYVKDQDTETEPRARDGEARSFPSASEDRSGARARSGEGSAASALPRGGTGPYTLVSPIGTTAYGQGYRARHTQGREVALHFLELEDDPEGTLARQLPLIVAKCGQLVHPNVVSVLDHGREGDAGRYFLVTAPLEGTPLAAQLDDAGTLPLARTLSITLQIGRALRTAHNLAIVHGALTPANVRLVQTEQGESVRVIGFGHAMIAPGSKREPRPAAPYEAPECAAGAAPDARSDVFALGCLIYRMLTGRTPVVRDDQGAPPLADVSREPVPAELAELVAQSLEPSPDARLADMVAFTRELREIAQRVNERAAQPGSAPPIRIDDNSVPPPDNESPSIVPGEPQGRRDGGAMWILASLMVALAAVWLLWEASNRVRPPQPIVREPGARSPSP